MSVYVLSLYQTTYSFLPRNCKINNILLQNVPLDLLLLLTAVNNCMNFIIKFVIIFFHLIIPVG